MFSSKGKLRYSNNDGYRLVVEIDQELANYYRSLIPKYYVVNRPRWPAHITVVRSGKEIPSNLKYWNKYNGEKVTFSYDNVVQFGREYYWLNIWCTQLEKIREELGLSLISKYTLPPVGYKKCFHCTIANTKEM